MKVDFKDDYNDLEEEGTSIDIMAIVKRLWNKRKYIIVITSCFMVMGLILALLSRPVYKSSCSFVPQMASGRSTSASALAALAGMSTFDMEGGSTLSPLIYPQLLENADLLHELLYTELHFEEWDEPVSLFDYYMNPDYQKKSITPYIYTYTYGWPLVLLKRLMSKGSNVQQEVTVPVSEELTASVSRIGFFSEDESGCLGIIKGNIAIDIDKNDGFLELSCVMGEKLAAAELCEAVFNLLDKYITEFKIEKHSQTLAYINERYEEVHLDYQNKQMALAEFNDANRGILSATAQTRRDQLVAEYNLAFSTFSDISKKRMQAEMQVKEDQPVLSVVKSIVVPNKPSNSRLKKLIIFTFLGGVLAVGSVIGFDFLKKQGSPWPEWWSLDEDPALLPEEEKEKKA
jgi:uncharacterized protein YutD